MAKKRIRSQRIPLPDGCHMSTPSVHPANWKTPATSCASIWYIQYRFYDPRRKPDGKQIIVKGMNDYQLPAERRQVTEHLLKKELAKLHQGYNPMTGAYAEIAAKGDIDEYTPLVPALHWALKKCEVVAHMKACMKSMMNYVPQAAELLGIDRMPISEIRRKHVKRILDKCGEIKETFSADAYNKYRTWLMILFSEIVQMEAIESNPITKDLKKKKTVKRLRPILSPLECFRVDAVLRWFVPSFWRFMHIFFHSGSRKTEILIVQGKHVNLQAQTFIRLVKKDRAFKEVRTTIKDIALPLWREAMAGCGREDYVFGCSLRPGPKPMRTDQINKRWKLWIKGPLGIEADFYSLKHLNTEQTVTIAGDEAAASHNAHTSTALVVGIYDGQRSNRDHEKMKKVNNPLVG